MLNLKSLAAATLVMAMSGGAMAVEQSTPQTPPAPNNSSPLQSLDGTYRLSQTATCILDGKRYNKGARMCIGGVYNYCNSKGLWEPSNLTC